MPVALGSRPLLASKARLRWDRRSGCHMLLYPERGLRLNETGAAILLLCDGARTVEQIVSELAAQYQSAERADLERETIAFLDTLDARGLLQARG